MEVSLAVVSRVGASIVCICNVLVVFLRGCR